MFIYLVEKRGALTFHASSKYRNTYISGSIMFYEADYYENYLSPFNISKMNFTSLVRIIIFVKYAAFCLGSQNYCDF